MKVTAWPVALISGSLRGREKKINYRLYGVEESVRRIVDAAYMFADISINKGSVSLEILHLAFKRQVILMAVYEPGFQEPQHQCWDEVSFIGSDLQTTLSSSRARLFSFWKLTRTNFFYYFCKVKQRKQSILSFKIV